MKSWFTVQLGLVLLFFRPLFTAHGKRKSSNTLHSPCIFCWLSENPLKWYFKMSLTSACRQPSWFWGEQPKLFKRTANPACVFQVRLASWGVGRLKGDRYRMGCQGTPRGQTPGTDGRGAGTRRYLEGTTNFPEFQPAAPRRHQRTRVREPLLRAANRRPRAALPALFPIRRWSRGRGPAPARWPLPPMR